MSVCATASRITTALPLAGARSAWIGGFGPWAPVLHCDSSLAGYDYVYYGHAGPANQLAVGTHVSAGQVMSSIGPGIVGISTGPHLEIGFCDSSGSPIGPQTAGTMLSLLQSSY